MDFENIPIEIIKGIDISLNSDKLYFLINDKPPTKVPNAFYFSIDEVFFPLLRIYNMSHFMKISDP